MRSRSPSDAISGSASRLTSIRITIRSRINRASSRQTVRRSNPDSTMAPACAKTALASSRATISATSNCTSRPITPSTVLTSAAVTLVLVNAST